MSETSKKNIIIAMSNANFAEAFKKHFEREQFKVLEIVVVLEHLIETLEMLTSEGERVDGIILTSDLGKKLEDRRLELLSDVLLTIRERYSEMNIIVLANEKEGHPFLAELVTIGIYNIFLKSSGERLNIPGLIETFDKPLPFADVAHLRNIDTSIPWRREFRGAQSITINLLKREGEQATSEIPEQEYQQKTEPNDRPTKIRTRTKTVTETIIKEKTVEITISKYLAIPSKVISVVSLYPQVGATFLVDNLSFYLAEKKVPVGVIEPPSHLSVWYELLEGDKKRPPEWEPWIKQIKEKGYVTKGTEWIENGVYYMPYGKEDLEEFSQDEAMKLLYLTKQIPLLFVDISDNLTSPLSEVAFHQSDEIWVVMSGDPVQINLRLERLMNYFKTLGVENNVFIIGNKWSSTLDDYLSPETIQERTGLKLITTIPNLRDINLSATWSGKRAIETKARESLSKPLMVLAERILPHEVTKEFKEKQSLLKLFKR